jgi:hypothetical protein
MLTEVSLLFSEQGATGPYSGSDEPSPQTQHISVTHSSVPLKGSKQQHQCISVYTPVEVKLAPSDILLLARFAAEFP